MTSDEIAHLLKTLPKRMFNKNDEVWRKAFIEYTIDTENKLGMGCNSCYYKVFSHLNQKYKSLESSS